MVRGGPAPSPVNKRSGGLAGNPRSGAARGGDQAGELAAGGQVPQTRRQALLQMGRVQQHRRLRSPHAQQCLGQGPRLLVLDHPAAILAQAGQLPHLRDGIVEGADRVDQAVLHRRMGGPDAAVGQVTGIRLHRCAVEPARRSLRLRRPGLDRLHREPLQQRRLAQRLAVVVAGLVRAEPAAATAAPRGHHVDEAVVRRVDHVLPDLPFLAVHVLERRAAVLDLPGLMTSMRTPVFSARPVTLGKAA